jgi:hypothetical protein
VCPLRLHLLRVNSAVGFDAQRSNEINIQLTAKRDIQNKTGRAPKAIDQLYLVAGAGFEPTTFGL